MNVNIEELYAKVRATLELANTNHQVINVIRDHFFPPKSTGIPRPQKRSFVASRMVACSSHWLKGNPTYFDYYAMLGVTVDPQLDYRYICLTYRGTEQTDVEALLVTPKGLDTIKLKTEIFFSGWDIFLGDNPDFKIILKEDLKLTRVTWSYRPTTQRLVIERSATSGIVRKTGILQPELRFR